MADRRRPDWVEAARRAVAEGPTALVTVLATEGSAPRGPGTRMVVTEDGLAGTIGGGALEYRATAQARAVLKEPPGTWRVQDYPLGPLLGQCCGGRTRLLVERLDARSADWLDEAVEGRTLTSRLTEAGVSREVSDDGEPSAVSARGDRPAAGAVFAERLGEARRPLLLFGAGHVGRAVARAANGLPFDLTWLDTRAEMTELPGVACVDEAEAAAQAASARADAAVLVMTHEHRLDYELTAAALRGAAAWVGLIGSETKRARFLSRLAGDGFDDTARARLVCPIGLPGIEGKAPEVIAVSVLAQLLALGSPA